MYKQLSKKYIPHIGAKIIYPNQLFTKILLRSLVHMMIRYPNQYLTKTTASDNYDDQINYSLQKTTPSDKYDDHINYSLLKLRPKINTMTISTILC